MNTAGLDQKKLTEKPVLRRVGDARQGGNRGGGAQARYLRPTQRESLLAWAVVAEDRSGTGRGIRFGWEKRGGKEEAEFLPKKSVPGKKSSPPGLDPTIDGRKERQEL